VCPRGRRIRGLRQINAGNLMSEADIVTETA
jgi:hypothetical protein